MTGSNRGGSKMFRERMDQKEVCITHDLSRKISMKKHEKRGSLDGDQYISSKIEMRFSHVRGAI